MERRLECVLRPQWDRAYFGQSGPPRRWHEPAAYELPL